MPNNRGSGDGGRRYRREEPFPRGAPKRDGNQKAQAARRMSRSRSPLMARNQPHTNRDFYQTYDREHGGDRQQLRRSRDRERSSPFRPRLVPGPLSHRQLRMDEIQRPRSRSRSPNRQMARDRGAERRLLHDANDHRNPHLKQKTNSNSVFADLDRAVKKAREEKGFSYWNKKVIEAEERDPNRWGHSGFKELYARGSNSRDDTAFRRTSPPGKRALARGRSPERLLPRRARSPGDGRGQISLLKSLGGIIRVSPDRSNQANSHTNGMRPKSGGTGQSKEIRNESSGKELSRSRLSEISTVFRKRSPEKSSGRSYHTTGKGNPKLTPSLRAKTSRDPPQDKGERDRERNRNSSISDDSSRTPSPQLKNKNNKSDAKVRKSASSSDSSSDEDVLEIHARDRQRSLSASSDDSVSGDSLRKTRSTGGNSSRSTSESESSDAGGDPHRSRGPTGVAKRKEDSSLKKKKSNEKLVGKTAAGPASSKGPRTPADKSNTGKAKDKSSESESDSSSDSEDEPRMTLSERFAKLSQTSTDKREFAKPEISIKEIDTKLKVVKDLRNANTKVITSQLQKPAARTRPKSPEIQQDNGEMRYSSDERRRHFERMSRDEPKDRDRPEEWSDARVRYNYYKTRGYFDKRPLSLDEYVKWEAWWYDYRDWLAGEGYYDQPQQPQPYGGGGAPDRGRNWRPSPHRHDEVPPQEFQRRGPPQQSFVPPGPEPLMGRPLHFSGSKYGNESPHPLVEQPHRVPISRRIGHSFGGSLVVNVRHHGQGNFRGGGKGRLAGRIGFWR